MVAMVVFLSCRTSKTCIGKYDTAKNFLLNKDSNLLEYSSEVYLLGKEIDGFVKSDIAKLVNKLK